MGEHLTKLKLAGWLFKLCSTQLSCSSYYSPSSSSTYSYSPSLSIPLLILSQTSLPTHLSFPVPPFLLFSFLLSFLLCIPSYPNLIVIYTIHSHSSFFPSFPSLPFPSSLTHHILSHFAFSIHTTYRNMILSLLEVAIVNKFLSVLQSQTGQLSPCCRYPERSN